MNEYSNESIKSLKGADRVRLRPGIIFGTNDINGCTHSVFEIISNSIDEAKAGYGDTVNIKYMADGTVIVEDFGRGVPMDWNANEQRYNWELVFAEMYAGGKMDADSMYDNSLGLNGLGCCATQYASEYMIVTSCRDGYKYTMNFKKGVPVGELQKVPYDGPTGTKIEFKPDLEVFTAIVVDPNVLHDMCRKQALTNAGVHLVVDYEGYEPIDWYYENGASEFIEQLLGPEKLCDVASYAGEIFCQNSEDTPEYKLKMEIALSFSRQHVLEEFYHNSSHLEEGGKTLDGFRKGAVKVFKKAIKESGKFQKGDELINIRDIEEILCCVFISWCPGALTFFGNQTKKKVLNECFEPAVARFTEEAITRWIAENQKESDRVLAEIVANKKIREKADNVRSSAIKKLSSGIDSFGSQPQKFVGCASKDKNERELYIVEGDSALGSCKLARNGQFQALMPVRGKITNCLKEDLVKVLNSDIILDLLQVMGCGIEVQGKNMKELPKFDIDKLNFDKLIICTDADLDGMQIRCLLLTFFYILTPTLLREGKVYIAETPLYEITCGKETRFAYDEKEKDAILKEFDGRRVKIQRSKGLGENDPEMMSISTMRPDTRRLIKVDYAGAEQDINFMFNALLGEDITSRRVLINEYASAFDTSIL